MSPSPAPSRAAVKQLADERDAVERELAATIDALMAPGGGGLSGPLVDADGFPRVRWVVGSVETSGGGGASTALGRGGGRVAGRGCERPRPCNGWQVGLSGMAHVHQASSAHMDCCPASFCAGRG